MKLISCNIADSRSLSEERGLSRDILAKNLVLLHQRGAVLKSSPSFTCSSHLSRSYVEQISSVVWSKTKHGRTRSNSYPFIKRFNPLPRVIEEDESLEETPQETHRCASGVQVQTLNWTDNKLSEQWLNKINSLRSTMTELSWPIVKRGRPRSNSFPFVKYLNTLPCVTEEDETTEDDWEKPEITNAQVPKIQTLNYTGNNLSHELLDKINFLRSTLSTVDHSSRRHAPYHSAKRPAAKCARSEKPVELNELRQDVSAMCKRASTERSSEAADENNNNHICVKMDTSRIHKPDSTYISLISGITHETSKRAHAQSSEIDSDTNEPTTNCELKREKKWKKVRCVGFSPRKLFCSSARQNINRQISNSSE